ncbi:MAG: RNA polymerase sigma factor [Phycisphaerae bacterium]|nr:RNA polymerase sigma factor [Phycisphaerae bacterium]
MVRRTLAGELPAFDTLVGRYQKRAVSASYRLLGNSHDAMEVCQDAFLRAYQSLGRLKEPTRFGPWLIRIVSNLSLNFRRSRRATAALPVDDALGTEETATAGRPRRGSGHSTPPDPLSSGELAGQIERAVAELPEKQRLALVLFAIEGWPQRDVAEVLGCSLEAVKWNVFQARKTLKVKLAEHL